MNKISLITIKMVCLNLCRNQYYKLLNILILTTTRNQYQCPFIIINNRLLKTLFKSPTTTNKLTPPPFKISFPSWEWASLQIIRDLPSLCSLSLLAIWILLSTRSLSKHPATIVCRFQWISWTNTASTTKMTFLT